MKLLYVITKATAGGAQEYVFELASHAKQEGVEVAVAYGTHGLLVERLAEAGIRALPLTKLTRDINVANELGAFLGLLKILRQEKPSVVHLNSSKAGGLGALAARIAGIRHIVFTAHGWPHQEPRPAFARLLIWLASWMTVWLSTEVIVVSENDFRKTPVLFSRAKIRLIRNGIEAFPLKERSEARTEIMTHASTPLNGMFWILSVGELHPNKDMSSLITAFSHIAKRHDTLSLVIIGAGQEESKLRELIERLELSKRILLTGFLRDSLRYLAAADIFVLPSRKEGLPFVLLEAGLAGLPTITSNVGGMPEIIINSETGMLVPSHAPEALATALDTLVQNPAEANRYGAALKARVEKEFSKEQMIEKTFALYRA